jgi:hypothetical protein
MTLASGLNSKLAEMLPESQVGRRFAEFAYNNKSTEDNILLRSHCETSHSKGFSVSERTFEDDMDKLAKNGLVDKHRSTVVLDGQTYPTVVYGSLDAFKADIEQAEQTSASQMTNVTSDALKPEQVGQPASADAAVEPLPFSRDVADKLEHYRISRDQWRKETLGGELVAVRFSELIDQVDGEARRAVLKIPAPEVFSTNLALKQVLANRPSGLKMLGRWSA